MYTVYFTELSVDFLRLDGTYGTATDEIWIRKDSNEAVVAEPWHYTVICVQNWGNPRETSVSRVLICPTFKPVNYQNQV